MKFQDFVPVGEALKTAMDRIYSSSKKQDEIIKTGFPGLDKALGGGIKRGQVVVIGGRPAMGKTALALNLALNMTSAPHENPVAYFYLEGECEFLASRIWLMNAGVERQKLMYGQLTGRERQALPKSKKQVEKLRLYINDRENSSWPDISYFMRGLFRKTGPGILIIDYLQLMEGADKPSKMKEIMPALKFYAQRYNLAVLLFSQLSRAVNNRKNHADFSFRDLRGGRIIAETADIVIFIHRQDYYAPVLVHGCVKMDLIIAKGGIIKKDKISLVFNKRTGRIW